MRESHDTHGHVSYGQLFTSGICLFVCKLQSTLKALDQAWKDDPWEEEFQICTKEIDPSWGWTIGGLKRGSYINIVPCKIVCCKHDLH